MASWRWVGFAALAALVSQCTCNKPSPSPPPQTWAIVAQHLPSALMSVDGTSSKDVYACGSDKGAGPLVVHWDGSAWTKLATGFSGDLWWVHATPGGAFFGGAGGLVLSYDGQKFTRLEPPFALARQTVFGVWGASPTDVYAVGGSAGREGFVWHWDGTAFRSIDLPLDVPRLPNGEAPGMFKVWGDGTDVWVVGGAGTILRKHGAAPFVNVPSGTKDMLFTVHGAPGTPTIVGGTTNAAALIGSAKTGAFTSAAPRTPSGILQGVYRRGDDVWASGEKGIVYELHGADFEPVDTKLPLEVGSLHSMYIDDQNGVWSVGGNVLGATLDDGAIIHRGVVIAPVDAGETNAHTMDAGVAAVCPREVVDIAANKSAARRWDEQILASIRRDLPRPTVHARNLFHVSAAMWDAWAAYDSVAKGVFVKEKQTAGDVGAARAEAISYAAYRVLVDRYTHAVGGPIDLACYRAVMTAMGYDPSDATDTGSTPRALGNRIGEAINLFGATDGANQAADYADPAAPALVNAPLVVDDPATALVDPNVWQPLNLSIAATQNGIVLPAGVQGYVGSQWGNVKPFAMKRASSGAAFHDPGPPPLANARVWPMIEEVITRSSELDPSDGVTMDVSPGAYGNNTLGANDGKGRAENPITHEPYAPQIVKRGDFGRALAEFWADGPSSETPPGHWNVIANLVADAPHTTFKLFGAGAPLDPLSWDVHVYLALNGAVHDAGITAWEGKRRSMTVRPISLIRFFGKNKTLPIVPGLIEEITAESSAPGQRHAHLALYKGEIALHAWRSEPCDRKAQLSGVGWIRAADWVPYQRRTFVTPAFPAFISGHSTFSRAGAEVMALITGSPYFPGGLGEYVLPKNSWLTFERGPSTDIRLQWASYFDASDQAGQSRIWGGIHISADDFVGRQMGSKVGKDAVALAVKYFNGTAP
jgi:hypothetical protein